MLSDNSDSSDPPYTPNHQKQCLINFQVFQLGYDGFDEAINELNSALNDNKLESDAFIAITPGKFAEVAGPPP